MRHLVMIVVVICAVIGNGWAQNRGSSRYAPQEDYDGESTRAPRPSPTRGAGLRRQRTTKAPEPSVVEDELKSYQPPELPTRTSGRVPQSNSLRQVAPPPPPPVPVEEAVPLYPSPGSENPQSPPSGTEGRPQGTRRRRPKKRRKPQAITPNGDEESHKQIAGAPENDKVAISELLNEDRKRTEEFQSNTQLRNAPANFNSDPNLNIEKTTWNGNPSDEQHLRNTAEPQYFRPQPASNRLPIDDSHNDENSRGYFEPSPGSPNEYAPRETPNSVRNKASYVPILTPFRAPPEDASRLPPEDYPLTRNKESTSQTLPIDPDTPYLAHGNRAPGRDPNNVIRNSGTQPIHNIIPQPNEPAIPGRGHSEVRLPENEQPLLSHEYGTNFDSAERLPLSAETNAKTSDIKEESANPTNRFPNPSEIHYESVYPEFTDGPQRTSGRRVEPAEPNARRTPPSYSTPRRDGGTKPQEYDNDAEVDRRQASQYRPPLQRTSLRYKPEDSDGPARIRTQQSPSTSPPRGRGSSRHQPPTDNIAPERTRSPTRHSPEPSDNSPRTSSSSSQSQSTTRTRGTQRYAPETIESAPRSSSRRQQENVHAPPPTRNPEYSPPSPVHESVDEIIEHDRRSPSQAAGTYGPPPSNLSPDNHPEDRFPIRNTLRSRPQHEVRGSEPVNAYEESSEEPDEYNTEYQVVRQPTTRGRANQRPPTPRQQPTQPEYRAPTNRQQNAPEPSYETPQNSRSRQQSQYQAPQNPRSDHRDPSSRQNAPRQQGRPRHQEPEPPAARARSTGGNNFKCPDAFGFFSDSVQCDKYYECRNGTATVTLCSDGLAFNEVGVPNFVRCDSLRDVDCKSRPELQEPQPSPNCPRRFGLFPHESDCTKFWNCVDGTATEIKCPPGLSYSDPLGTCDWADLVESGCRAQDLLGFTCPDPTAHDLMDGVYSRYPHPSNCQLHFTCIKGTDGLRRPRMLSCNEGQVFDPESASCKRPEEVPGCEDFYGPRSPPKKKPARQPSPREPEPEEEYIEEEPTPRPRRRGSSNRRTRN